jgi:2-polyprenyl-3-methyl-5-hydroxy-6-metoxy-1,4-benzoquinol methylase
MSKRNPGATPGKAAAGAAGAGYYDGLFGRVKNYRCTPRNSRHFVLWDCVARHVPPASRVLEIGVGTGQLAELLHERGVRHYTGFDFSPVGVKMAQARKLPGFKFFVGDARDSKNYEYEYDLAISTEVLEHLDDDLAMFGRLRPGVRFLFSVPSTGVEKSHVRFFKSVADVQAHYAGKLRRMKVGTLNNGEWYFVQGFVR